MTPEYIESHIQRARELAEQFNQRVQWFQSFLNLVAEMNAKILQLENDVRELKAALKRDAD